MKRRCHCHDPRDCCCWVLWKVVRSLDRSAQGGVGKEKQTVATTANGPWSRELGCSSPPFPTTIAHKVVFINGRQARALGVARARRAPFENLGNRTLAAANNAAHHGGDGARRGTVPYSGWAVPHRVAPFF
jgi:hypothetical protein